jgi:hypothetical protein
MKWLRAWLERRRRMRWFADEFLPELMAAAQLRRSSPANPAQTVSVAAHAMAESDPLMSPMEAARSLQKLDELLRRLPDTERERLKTLFRPPR